MNNYLESEIDEYVGAILDGVEQLAEENNETKENVLKRIVSDLTAISKLGW